MCWIGSRRRFGFGELRRFLTPHIKSDFCTYKEKNMTSVLITGASRGIGRATAIEFVKRGYRVVATARNPQTLNDLDVDQRLRLDVTDQESVESAIESAGEIDVLVSNAALIFLASVEASPVAEIERIFAANTSGAIRVAQALLPQMRERGAGRLLFVSSALGRVVLTGTAAYASTKWALEALVESLAIESAPFGIHTTLLQPGAVSSGALDDALTYRLDGDPYAGSLASEHLDGSGFITVDEVARAIADTAELETPPLRVPVGDMASLLLSARKDAPEDVAFVPLG
jgi:NAD(P)-dependent dehydrogenase (short-subunit alcohol dehydrogenase family)